MYKKITCFITFLMLLFLSLSYASNEGFEFISFEKPQNSNSFKLNYGLSYLGEYEENDYFKVDFYFNNSYDSVLCSKTLNLDEDMIFSRKTCDVEDMGSGTYQFIGYVLRDGLVYKKHISTHYLNKDSNSNIEFIDYENQTQVNIYVDSNLEKVTLYHDIPKEVIPRLTYENMGQYITSSMEFEIIEENPLIAWNLEAPPKNVSYKLNKKLSDEEKLKFKVNIEETKSFLFFKFLTSALILILVILIFRPILENQSKKMFRKIKKFKRSRK